MPIKQVISRGLGFSPGTVAYIIRGGLSSGAAVDVPTAAPYVITRAFRVIESYLQKGGFVEFVEVGDPEALPTGSGIQARLTVRRRVDTLLSLNQAQIGYSVQVTLYLNAFADSPELIELRLADAVRDFVSDLLGDWSLSGTIEWLEDPIAAEWGYVNVAGTVYRVAVVTLPILAQFLRGTSDLADELAVGAFSSAWSAAFD